MLVYECPSTPLKISLPENKTTVNLKSASFIVIMLLHKGLTHFQSQIKPQLLFGESFTLSSTLPVTNMLLGCRAIVTYYIFFTTSMVIDSTVDQIVKISFISMS